MHFHIDSFYCKKNSMAKLQPTSIHGQKYWIFLSNQNRNRKFVVLCSLFSVVEIVSFYILVLNKIDISESDPKYLLTKECKKQEMSSHIIWPYAGFAVVWLGVRWEVWGVRREKWRQIVLYSLWSKTQAGTSNTTTLIVTI